MTPTESSVDSAYRPAPDGTPAHPLRPARPARRWLATGLAAATSALQACGGGGGGGDSPAGAGVAGAASGSAAGGASGPALPAAGAAAVAATGVAGGAAGPLAQARSYATPANDEEAARFLLQAQFSASDGDIAAVRSLGYAGWLARQFDTAPGMGAWDWLNTQGYAVRDQQFNTSQADYALWYQLIQSPDALRKRVALALSEICVISIDGLTGYWPSHLAAAWWDMLSAHAFGNYRELLEAVALSPAMGLYLSIRGSQKENAAGRQPDENFARELMQLMTIGLVELQPDGTPALSGGQPVETYGQADVSNLARVFSGYDFDLSATSASLPDTSFTRLPMAFIASRHSTSDVAFLGTRIAGSTDGPTARKMALDTLFQHRNVGPFIGRQLIQRLVTSNPSPAYVARVAAAFADNGKGVRGDIAATVAAVLLDDEARGPAGLASNRHGKLREPMLRVVQWARSFELASASGNWKIPGLGGPTQLGQSPLRAPSVFNFFRPAYVPPSTAIAQAGLVAPEFQLVNETTVSAYANYLVNMVRYGFPVAGAYDMAPAYAAEKALAADAAALVRRLNLVLAAGQLSPATVAMIVSALNTTALPAGSSEARQLDRIAAAVLMVMVSPEYLVQK